jgi:hypothetical protein
MKKATILIVALMFIASPAMASGKHKSPKCHKQPIKISVSNKTINNKASASSKSFSASNASSESSSSSLAMGGSATASTGPSTSQAIQQTQREYPAAVQPEYGPTTISTSVDDAPQFGYTLLEKALAGKRWFTRGALESLASGVKIVGGYKTANETPLKASTGEWMHLVILDNPSIYPGINKPYSERTADVKGYAEGQSTEYGNTLVGLFAVQALQAMDDGCNVLVVHSQGYSNWDHTSGGGIGFAAVRASDHGNGSGGTGWAWAEAGKYARSTIGAVGIVDSLLVGPGR